MIRRYTSTDEEKLRKLIANKGMDSDILYLARSPSCIYSFAAYDEEEMVGCIIAWKSNFHPFCTYFKIISHPKSDKCIGELLAVLEENLGEADYPLQTGIGQNTILDYYYKKKNFNIIRKTYLPTIHLSDISNYSKQTTNLNIKSIEEITQVQVEQLVRLVKRIYEETHLINPVENFKLDKWSSLIFADDLIQEGSYVYLDDKRKILAYSLLHKTDDEHTVELGWKGTKRKSEIENINTLIQVQIEYAKRKGYQKIEGEFDTTDPYAMEVLNQFKFPRSPVWVTFQKSRKGMI